MTSMNSNNTGQLGQKEGEEANLSPFALLLLFLYFSPYQEELFSALFFRLHARKGENQAV